jgi:hypothetical protein
VRLTATAFDEAFEQITACELTAGWAPADGETSAPLPTELTADAALQEYRGELVARASEGLTLQSSGDYAVMREARLQVAATESGEEIARTSVDIQLLDDSIELLDPRPAPENLETLAQLSGGQVFTRPAELTELLRGLQSSEGEVLVHKTPLWDRSWLWLSILFLLAIEWSLRRRAGFG